MHPSELLERALVDLEKAETDDRYVIDFNCWHRPDRGKTHVCLAGCYMAFSLNVRVDQLRHSFDMGLHCRELWALDFFSRGHVLCGLAELSYYYWGGPKNMAVYSYLEDEAKFKVSMNRIRKEIQNAR